MMKYKYFWDKIMLTSKPPVYVYRLCQEKPYKEIGVVSGNDDSWKWEFADGHVTHWGYKNKEDAINELLFSAKIKPETIRPQEFYV